MKYCWGIAVVLSLGIVGGCSGGTTTSDDAGTDAFVAPRDAIIGNEDVFRDVGPQDANIHAEDAPLDAFRADDTGVDANVSPDTGVDANVSVDANVDADVHDGGTDGGHDAATTVDGGCLAIEGEMGVACDPADPTAHVCAAGFTCQANSGIVLTHSCQIRCDSSSFTCPCGTSCFDHSDKGSTWRQCDQL